MQIIAGILGVWFIASFGCGILFKETLDQYSIGGAPFGFWMAQQGSIICFVVLLVTYTVLMNRLDDKYGFAEDAAEAVDSDVVDGLELEGAE